MPTALSQPEWSAALAVDLVNTATVGPDALATPHDLRRFLLAHAEPEPVVVTAADLAAVRRLRQRLRQIFEAAQPADRAEMLNRLLTGNATRPYLTDHDGTAWHLHVSRPGASWAQWLAARTSLGLALVVAGGGIDRLRACAAGDCRAVLLENSRNHTRRFCSPTCATRTRVAAHRARRAGPADRKVT